MGLKKTTVIYKERFGDKKRFGNIFIVIKAAKLHKSGVCHKHYSEFPTCKLVCRQENVTCNYFLTVGTYTEGIKQNQCKIYTYFYFLKNLFMRKNIFMNMKLGNSKS